VKGTQFEISGCNQPLLDGVQAESQPFTECHFPVAHWSKLWGFSAKTIREWFQDEYGPGILRHANTGRRKTRDYVTLMISARAAARVYEKHCAARGD
jgi:hypothetical protein